MNENKEELGPSIRKVDEKRRSFSKVGVLAPVVMTLASRPAFGALCLSNMLSGNVSDPTRGDECYGGGSPGYWCVPNPGQTDLGDNTLDAWTIAGFHFGDYDGVGNNNKWESYTSDVARPNPLVTGDNFDNGTKLSSTILSGYISHSAGDVSLSYIINNKDNTIQFHLIAGLLNSYYYEAKGAHYIVTPTQYLQILNGSHPIPKAAYDIYGGSNTDRITFLVNLFSSSYHYSPGSSH